MGYIISTVNMKGGVGKTTLTVNLAACLAKAYNKKVLVLDLDSQISATLSLLPPHEFGKLRKNRKTLSYLLDLAVTSNLHSKLPTTDLIISPLSNLSQLHLLPGDIELYDEYLISEKLHQQAIQENKASDFEGVWNNFESLLLQDILKPVVANYDFIILDCAPGYNILTRSALAASDFYILPARPEFLSLVGIQLLERRVRKLRESHQDNHSLKLQLLGIVFILSQSGLFGRYAKYYEQVKRRIKQDFPPEKIFLTEIPMDVNVAKAVDASIPVTIITPDCNASKAFYRLTEEFLQKLTQQATQKQSG
ncbi:MAG: ParA family protein [Geminocystis sp.]|nr:ParA family protein [Geminocystis sp.]HIK36800.1 ParA family protein [Geminocystis sp. M7585_C2015_104]MCS7146890.1 ParA family protein [Geminocystis sp.]MCX8078910.1 ParA family protein [Geminocystis sp.]MDW8115715.1 ParA family protein [Geminocystis sp.]